MRDAAELIAAVQTTGPIIISYPSLESFSDDGAHLFRCESNNFLGFGFQTARDNIYLFFCNRTVYMRYTISSWVMA